MNIPDDIKVDIKEIYTEFSEFSPMLSPKIIGLLRGAGYALAYALCHFLAQNLGSVLDPSVSVIVVAIIGIIDHALQDPVPLAGTKS